MTLTLDSPKKHINLTVRADLYGIAQENARSSGISVSGLFERWLLALALAEEHKSGEGLPDSDMAGLRGILTGPLAGLDKRQARALSREALLERRAR
jgi:hypothetical protein